MNLAIEEIKFLVADDHPFQRKMVEQILYSLGATQVLQAADGVEAARIMRGATRIDVVICDIMMPDVDGLELIPMIGALAPAPGLLLMSAADWPLDIAVTLAKAHNVPVLGAVSKPLTPDKIRPLLEAYLGGVLR